MSWFTQEDFDRWLAGEHFDSYHKLGAHPVAGGVWFAVWAPHADYVAVIGDFNGWNPGAHPLRKVGGWAGLWEAFVPEAKPGHHYKYRIQRGYFHADKTDPFAFRMEAPVADGNPVAGLSAIVTELDHTWGDDAWMNSRKGPGSLDGPVAAYEVHLGSWRRKADGYSLGYREIAEPLADHVEKLGFTHVELMPVMEHPYYASWGYQVVGYYAPTYRYGTPQDLMYLIDYLHRRGIGVILDWVPAHFATDPQGLVFFDGSTLYEYDDPLMRYHPDWGTYVFDYNKPGVRNFLISNALFWLDYYHADGLRFDAVASMLYRDYSRDEWHPNRFGGRENLEAISLLKTLNERTYERFPEVMMIAEESTAWPKVTHPTYEGGLGFLYKWNMGWMHDVLEYMRQDPLFRKGVHDAFTFSMVYAYSEHYVLPFSHDEVVHGKGSLWGKMPGDPWQKAANLRLLYAHQVGHPGKKLLFMGGEFGQEREWNHDGALDWHLLDDPLHGGVFQWVTDLFNLYREHPALWNDTPGGFEWIILDDVAQSVFAYLRRSGDRTLVFVFNFTPVPREDYRVGMPAAGRWRQVLNSDAERYGGSGAGVTAHVETEAEPKHGHAQSVALTLPPLGALVFEYEKPEEKKTPPRKEGAKKAGAKKAGTGAKKAGTGAKGKARRGKGGG